MERKMEQTTPPVENWFPFKNFPLMKVVKTATYLRIKFGK